MALSGIDPNARDSLRLRRNMQRMKAGGFINSLKVLAPLTNNKVSLGLALLSTGGLQVTSSLGILLNATNPGLQLSASGLSVLLNATNPALSASGGLAATVSGTSLTKDATGLLVNLKANPGLQISSGLGLLLTDTSLVLGAGGVGVNLATNSGLQISSGLLVKLDGTSLSLSANGLKLGILTTKGDVLGFDTAPNRIPVGSNTQVLTADSTQTLGLKWAAASPLTTKGDVYTYDTANQRLAVGTDRQVLTADSTAGTGNKWANVRQSFSADPTSPTDGEIWYQSTSKSGKEREAGLTVANVSTAYTQTADGTAATNTLTQTTSVSAVTFPANFFTVGKAVRVKLQGTYSSGTTAGTLALGVYLHPGTGSDVNLDGNTGNPYATSANGARYLEELFFVCRSTGVGGTVECGSWILFGGASYTLQTGTPGPFTIDTTQTQQILIKLTWSATNASNTAKVTVSTVEVLDPP